MNQVSRNSSRSSAQSALAAVTVALAAGMFGCTAGAPNPPSASQHALGAAAELVLDDFATGAGVLVEDGVATQQATQTGTGIRGGTRCIVLVVTGNPLGRPTTVEIRNGKNSYLALDSGVGVDQAMLALYGYDEQCNAKGLDLDLADYGEFRIDFAALDLGAGGGITVWSDAGVSSAALSVDPGLSVTKHLAFSEFAGNADWHHIQQIAVEIASGGEVAAHDYALRAISAAPISPQ
jgi:hypothetical protein